MSISGVLLLKGNATAPKQGSAAHTGPIRRHEEETVSEHVAQPLRLTINGEPNASLARTLADLLAALGYQGMKVATAVNGDFVPERQRQHCSLAEGDAVEILAPRQGG